MHVLVTGGAGFIGSHVVDRLIQRGDEVSVVDDLSTGSLDNVHPAASLIVADITKREEIIKALYGNKFQVVVHAAAKTKVVESIKDPQLYQRVLIGGTTNVLEVALLCGADTVINLSTGGAMYGETPTCASELTPVVNTSPYAYYKGEAERVVESYTKLRSVTLRLANVYGPRQKTSLEGGVVAIFVNALKNKQPIIIYGDGSARRDYTYVADVVDAVCNSLDHNISGLYNIGTGVATSVNDLLEHLSKLLGEPVEVQYAPERVGELSQTCLDASKAFKDGVWTLATSLDDGLKLTVKD